MDVKVRSVVKSFGELLVLEHVSFNVDSSEFVAICGPTGCGKTTLMKIIAGLLKPDSGEILLAGEPVDYRRHNIGFVFQEPSYLPWRTVWGNVRFGLEAKIASLGWKLTREEVEERVKWAIELVGLEGFENYYPHQISGGMKQKAALAQALATDPDLLLMDEPFGALDIQTRYYMERELLRVWSKLKKTVIFVTHYIEEAVYLADRVVVLSSIPAKVKAEVKVPLPRPRDVTSSEFIEIRKEITELIRWW